jgi:predicted transcriptional regulator
MDLLDQGLTNAQAAAALGISPSAVSQRRNHAFRQEAQRGTVLAGRLLDRLRALSENGGVS